MTPSVVQVSTTAAGLAPGVYPGEIRFYELNRPEAAAAVAVTLTVEAPPGPLAIWSFDEEGRGAGISLADASGRGHDGVTLGSGTDAAPGVTGNARVFDGASAYLSVPASEDFAPSALTLRTWVKLADYPHTLGVVASALDGETPHGWFVGILATGNIVLMTVGPSNESLWLVSRRTLAPGSWHALTVTLNWLTGEAAVYTDGELDTTARFAPHPLHLPQPLVIGRASWWDGYYLPFAIDDTLLDSRVWTAAEIRADIASFTPPAADQPPVPAAEWRFDETEATATTLADSSGHAHHATVLAGGSQPVPGVAGNARAFGPAGYARIGPHPDFAAPSFSFSTWIRLDSYPQNWGVVFSNFDGDYRGWFVGVHGDGRVIFSLWGKPSFTAWVLSQSRLLPGEWHHLAVSFDDLSRRGVIYLDGHADRSFVAGGFTPQTTAALTFARASWFEGYYLACMLDEAKFFDRALPPADISRRNRAARVSKR
jgi:hypothetical protein